jgi:hypothetical protein
MRGTRISIQENGPSIKEAGKGQIHTLPLLQACRCRGAKERSGNIVRKTGIFVLFQWPKENFDFAKRLEKRL